MLVATNAFAITWQGQELLLETELIPVEGEALPEWQLNKPIESNNNKI